MEIRPEPFPRHPHHRSVSTTSPGPGPRRPQGLSGFVFEDDPPPCSAASLVPSPRCRPARPRWRPRHVRSPAASDLRAPADAVQQVGHPARGVGHPKQPPDQHGDPVQGPTLIDPAVRGRTMIELGDQPFELGIIQLALRPTPRRETPTPPGPRRSRPAATRGPTSGSPATGRRSQSRPRPARTCPRPAHVPVPGRRVPERSGHHHLRTPCPRRRPRPARDHADTPDVINKPNPSTSISGRRPAVLRDTWPVVDERICDDHRTCSAFRTWVHRPGLPQSDHRGGRAAEGKRHHQGDRLPRRLPETIYDHDPQELLVGVPAAGRRPDQVHVGCTLRGTSADPGVSRHTLYDWGTRRRHAAPPTQSQRSMARRSEPHDDKAAAADRQRRRGSASVDGGGVTRAARAGRLRLFLPGAVELLQYHRSWLPPRPYSEAREGLAYGELAGLSPVARSIHGFGRDAPVPADGQ